MGLVGIAKTHYGSQELVQFSAYMSTYFYLECGGNRIRGSELLASAGIEAAARKDG
jgi:hypothetical protein